MLTLLAPGQGSQKPGMLEPWLALPGATDLVATWSKDAGLDLIALGTTATADEITDTAITQPLVVASALLTYNELIKSHTVRSDTIIAGHSVGELAAAAVAGVISASDAVELAAIRGNAMAHACATTPTTMAAVLGGNEDEVLARIDELNLIPANRNATGQIVAAGAVDAIDELVASPPEKARIRKLAVAGAFHTRYMASARAAVAEAAANITPNDPIMPLLSNYDGSVVTKGADVLDRIVNQVTNPVRWDLCTATMRDAGVSGLFELAPGGTLTGIAKRELKGTPAVAVTTPEHLERFTELG